MEDPGNGGHDTSGDAGEGTGLWSACERSKLSFIDVSKDMPFYDLEKLQLDFREIHRKSVGTLFNQEIESFLDQCKKSSHH